MKTLPANASDEDILSAVREWVELLAKEEYEEAYRFFVSSEHNRWQWSPQLLKRIIRTYGGLYGDQEKFSITPVEKTSEGSEPRHDVHRDRKDEHKGYVWFDLPLNGKWSDLTAILTFQVNGGSLVIELESIEVM